MLLLFKIDTLKFPSGVALIAAKTYYFGVGGSLDSFKDMIVRDGIFSVETVWQTQSGVAREIIRLAYKV